MAKPKTTDRGQPVAPPSVRSLLGLGADPISPDSLDRAVDIYKTFVEMADRLSARRHVTNSFYVGLNTAVAGLLGYVGLSKDLAVLPQLVAFVSPAGMILSILWFVQLQSYRRLGSAKFEVIQTLETCLPVRPYYAEWQLVKASRQSRYLPFTHIESAVPWIFVALYLSAFLWQMPWARIRALL